MTTTSQVLQFTDPSSKLPQYFFHETHDKFKNDKLFTETTHYIIGIDGVLLNLGDLKIKMGIAQLSPLLVNLYQKHQNHLPQVLRGEFVGFVYEKFTGKLLYFTNQTATRKVFYTQLESGFVIAPNLEIICQYKRQLGQQNELDLTAAYSLLTYGTTIEDQTLVTNIRRLQAGELITIKNQQFQLNKYIDYNDIAISNDKESSLIEQLDHVFTNALYQEYQKDVAYDYQHLATLSGGLDSRMNVMLGAKLGYAIDSFCFSQSNYADEKIARQICNHLERPLQFIPLDDIPQVYDFEENIKIYDGSLFYLGSAHFNHALKQLDLKPYGLIHTGMIGDGLLGGLISAPSLKPPNIEDKLISKKLFPKIESEVQQIAKGYHSEDSFHLYNRVFNLTNSSAFVCEQYSYLVSPFMYPEFIQLCLSIPPKLKFKEKIYIKWINRFHSEFARFKWEKTGFRPNYHWKTQLSRYTNKARHIGYHFFGRTDQLNMTPYDYWYKKNPIFRDFYSHAFQKRIAFLQSNRELYIDVEQLFQQGNVIEKSMALSLLGAVEKYQLSV